MATQRRIAPDTACATAPPELPEHLSLVARWFYSKPREGEILFREEDWPYRRILRACAACSRRLPALRQSHRSRLASLKKPMHESRPMRRGVASYN